MRLRKNWIFIIVSLVAITVINYESTTDSDSNSQFLMTQTKFQVFSSDQGFTFVTEDKVSHGGMFDPDFWVLNPSPDYYLSHEYGFIGLAKLKLAPSRFVVTRAMVI